MGNAPTCVWCQRGYGAADEDGMHYVHRGEHGCKTDIQFRCTAAPSLGATAPDEEFTHRCHNCGTRYNVRGLDHECASALAPLGERPDDDSRLARIAALMDSAREIGLSNEAIEHTRWLLDRVAALRASLQAARDDVERLDWLERECGETMIIDQAMLMWRVSPHSGIEQFAATFREAIDAARLAQGAPSL